MWIGIGIAVWVVGYMVNYRIHTNAWRNKWDEMEGFIVFIVGILWPITIPIMLCIKGKDCFRKRTKRTEQIYWNASQGQIKTKAGACVYDGRTVELGAGNGTTALLKLNTTFEQRLGDLQSKHDYVKKQLTCSAKTQGKHKMVYEKMILGIPRNMPQFKCIGCGLEITKLGAELTTPEREALTKLKLI